MEKPRLLIATQNQGKWKEFESLLGSQFQCIKPDANIEVVEDGDTYFENALKKATQYASAFQMPVLSDDSGLEVQALEGRPGVHSARYGGSALSWPDRWQRLIEELRGQGNESWRACFRTVLCYYDGQEVPQFFQGRTWGRIVESPKGKGGFGYDPIFESEVLGKTFGEASFEEKQRISHRAEPVKKFLSAFCSSSS